ncbi:MAG TPA: ATP-binding protein [Candidatus Dormibacteraeota bacterium]|nr:ATP-binding protein [Candidatus Dormibacteraeota bacterium]
MKVGSSESLITAPSGARWTMPTTLELPKPHDGPSLTNESVLAADFDNRLLEQTAQLQRRNEELEAFSYSVSHDIKSPLSQIAVYLLFLKEHSGAHLDNLSQNYLAGIENCVERISRLTQDLLRLANTARTELRFSPLDLTQMARDIAAELSARAPARQVEWLIASGLQAEGDRGLIEILLTNLLSNAWKYTTHCSLARIDFGAVLGSEGVVEYHVRDNGAGFDMASAARLFQPFERLHTNAEFPGTGIGLATARRIIQRHGGGIWAEGAVGRGAVFHFTLGSKKV